MAGKKKKLEIAYVDINKIVPWEGNPKDHNIDAIIASIEEFDVTQPILVQEGTNRIIAGHGRYEAFRHLKLKKIPVMFKKISDGKAKALALVDNQTTMMRTWNDEKYELAIEEIQLEYPEFNFETYEFDMPEPEVDEEDEVPPLPKKAKTKKGDLYILDGKHRIMCGDSTKEKDIKRLMDGKKADMVFTDPPYNIGYEYNIYDDNQSQKDYEEFCKTVFSLILVHCKGPIALTPGMWNIPLWHRISPPKWIMAWVKMNGQSRTPLGGMNKWEPVLLWNPPIERGIDVIEANTDRDDSLAEDAPVREKGLVPKPIKLIATLIERFSKINNIILDVFLGSGTTLIASEKLNKICYGMEIDPLYCDVILKRYKNYKKSKGEKAIIKKIKKGG